MTGIEEGAAIAAIVAALATAAGTGVSLYSQDQTNKATSAAAQRASNNAAANQEAANKAAMTYRQQQEDLRNKQYDQVGAERDRQAQLQKEADAQLGRSENAASIAEQLKLQQQQQSSLGTDYAKSAVTDTNIPGVNAGAVADDEAGTRVVAGGYKDALKKVSAFLGGQASGQAGLDAVTGAGLMDSIGQNRNAANLSRISNFMKGSASVLPVETAATNTARGLVDQTQAANMALYAGDDQRIKENAALEINAAQHSGETGQSIGQLLGTTGTLAASYAGNAYGSKPKKPATTTKKIS